MIVMKPTIMRKQQRRSLFPASFPVAVIVIVGVVAMAISPCFGADMAIGIGSMLRASTLSKGVALDNDVSSTRYDAIITYGISNDCGLGAAAIMDEDGNTLKQGLIAATETIASQVLAESFSGNNGGTARRHSKRNIRNDGRVVLKNEDPVTITNIFPQPSNCAEGSTCLRVISKIKVVMDIDSDDQEDAVNTAIADAIRTSFKNGRFFNAIPEDTVSCPTMVSSSTMSHFALAHLPSSQ